ncbi:MAG TPA: hypothetical protein VN253_30070, partial [Kofleriaceae bacterium]|nr:hypothetical protein [Kofleriaceae bacterium]
AGAFFGRVNGNRIDWKQGATAGEIVVEMSPRLGVQYDSKGHVTNPGVSIEQWLAVVGKGRAHTVVIEIEPARRFQHDKSGRDGGDRSQPDSRAPQRVGKGAVGTTRSTAGGTKTLGSTTRSDDGDGGTANVHVSNSPTVQPGRDAKYPGEGNVIGKPGGAEKGPLNGKVGGQKQGSTRGNRDGTKTETGYFGDPAAPGSGTNDVTTDGSAPGGMVGGKGKKGDQGVPASSGLLPLISVPGKIAPAVTLGMILLDVDLANWADDVVKISFRLGKAAAGKGGALSKIVAKKFSRYVDREMERISEALAQEGQFIAKIADEQTEILRQIREAIEIETHAKLSAKLDQKATEGETWAKEATAAQNQFTDDTIRDSLEYADAARRAKDALPPKGAPAQPHVATHGTPQTPAGETRPSGSSTTSSTTPESAAKSSVRHPQEPSTPSKSPAQAAEHAGLADAKQRIWVRVDELEIHDRLTSQEWLFYIEAPLPNGNRHIIADGAVTLDAHGHPLGGPSFVLDKDVVIEGKKIRISVGTEDAPVSLTDLALDRSSEMYKARFKHEPIELPGSLIEDNRKIFQVEYLKAIDAGASHEAAELAAIRETPFGKARIRREYTEISVDTSKEPWETIQYGTPPKPRKVPRKIEATAKKH